MTRRIFVVIAAVGTLGLTIGDMEPGPILELTLPSGLVTEFATWVITIEKDRTFEAISERENMGASDDTMQRDLLDARKQLASEITRMEATKVMLTFLGSQEDSLLAFSCHYPSLEAVPNCFLH
jgi:hypothetical protein